MARLEELERKFEENPRRYFAPLANEYRKAGEAQRAADLCRSQLPEVPGHISGHIVLGQALYDARDFDGSRAALEAALALDPENIVALRYLGDMARDTGDAAEAERWYSRTLEADPYNEAATIALQALRSAPTGGSSSGESQQMTDETPQPAGDVAVESPEPLLATDSPAAGFEPTSYAEPEPAELVEVPSVMEVAPPVEIEDAGPTESAPETVSEEPTAPPTQPDPAEGPIAIAAEPGKEAEAQMEPVVEAPPEAPEVVEFAPEAAGEFESSATEILTVTGEFAGDLSVSAAAETTEPALEEPPAEERFDVAAHAPSEPEILEEAIQAEERVLESAAPFVTETMADLYLEQGYPHEALELLLQLAEQRPQDEQLRAKIEHIESVIVARRDAAVAAARAERAETADAAAGIVPAESDVEAVEFAEPSEAPFDAAVAEVDSSAFAASEPEPPISVRELFARMDRARPRAASSVTPRPISRRRSDFVPMPEGEAATSEASDDPFAFPNPPAPGPVPPISGPQQTFNPSTADSDDFDAWLRGLRGP
ncbi:MAG: tetratricopeptide repeat protein [Gemmatimonadaceae bacterium]